MELYRFHPTGYVDRIDISKDKIPPPAPLEARTSLPARPQVVTDGKSLESPHLQPAYRWTKKNALQSILKFAFFFGAKRDGFLSWSSTLFAHPALSEYDENHNSLRRLHALGGLYERCIHHDSSAWHEMILYRLYCAIMYEWVNRETHLRFTRESDSDE